MKKNMFFIALLAGMLTTNIAKAQLHIRINRLTLQTDLSFATPKNEMANYYAIGNVMKLYLDAGLSVVQIQYGKKSPVSFDISAFLGHENTNFDPEDYVSNGLDAKLTSYGVKLKPFYFKEKDKVIISILSGLFVEIGKSNARLIEIDQPDVNRQPKVFGYGVAPTIPLSEKTSFIFDFAFRKYNWINNSNTTSTISTFRTGLGLQFNF